MLLREPQSNAAKVFLFGESGTNQTMKAWRFFADEDSVRLPALTMVDSSSILLPVQHPDDLGNDLFCNGHSILPDGRMVFVGGTYTPRDPCEMVYTFDPAWIGGASPWTLNAMMAAERWYATVTALPDGKLLAAAGEARSWLGAFGGRLGDGTTDRVWRPLTVAGRCQWADTLAVPADVAAASGGRVRNDGHTAGRFPPSRADHAFAGVPNMQGVLFGGQQVFAAGVDTTLGDAWLMRGSAGDLVPNDSVVTWTLLKQVDYSEPVAGSNEIIPCPRTRATLVWAGQDPANPKTFLPGANDSLAFYLFGGRDSLGNALGDLWLGRVRTQSVWSSWPGFLGGLTKYLSWTQVLPSDTSRARFGHSMWFDPGRAGATGAPYARLVIFGGQKDDSTLADNRLYTYGVGSVVAGDWRVATPDSSLAWGSPQPRQGHMSAQNWALDPGQEAPSFYVFGGQDARGNLLPGMPRRPEELDTHLWAFERNDTTATNLQYQWKWLAWTKPDSGRPGPPSVARGAMAYEDWSKRLVVVGGDRNGDGQAAGLTDSVWAIQVESYGPGDNKRWVQPLFRPNGLLPEFPASSGHTLVAYGSGAHTHESSLEVFSTEGSLGSCGTHSNLAGTWATLTTPDSLSEREIAAYPFLFVLPDGRLFNAGPALADRIDRPYRRFFSFATKQWSDDATVHFKDAFAPGSAVMYRPGRLLRAGTHGPLDGTPYGSTGRTETVDIGTGATPGWVLRVGNLFTTFNLTPRINLNLTVLPTGDVLATGGMSRKSANLSELNTDAVRRPQLWRVATGGWNKDDQASADTLARDPRVRNYHSTALLLPDGRVMTAGGEAPSEFDRNTVSIYEPPYLFSGDAYARRPVVSGGPEVLRYGEPFTLTLAEPDDVDSTRTVALLRPAAVTHGFDQNQRYVPLDFVKAGSPGRLLAWAPADSFLAPPGEYMLFVTRGRGNSADSLPVPSLAKWVVVRRPTGTLRDSADITPPCGGTYSNLRLWNECENTSIIRLLWNAPADDDTLAFSGKSKAYNLRWTFNDSPPHFNLWQSQPTAAPQAVFAIETATVGNLENGTWYRFALKAVGDNADTSSLSNVLVAKATLCEGGSSGGGGGSYEDPHARRTGAFGQKPGAAGTAEENTLLAGVPLGTPARDMLRLNREPGVAGTLRRAFVRQGETRGLLVDEARLLAVDHEPGSEVVAGASGGLLAGTRLAATLVTDARARDVTACGTGAGPEPMYADSSEVLEVTLPSQAEPAPRVVLLELMGGGGETPGISVEVGTSGEAWQQLATIHPRREWDVQALPAVLADRVRLTFHGAYALRFAGELAGALPVTARAAALAGAQSNYSGDAFDETRAAVDTSLAMVAGDTLSLLFEDLPAPEAGVRTWLLEVEGTPVTPRVAQALAHRRDPAPQVSVPLRFALLPAAPNPTRGTVRLGFDLPVRASVRLELFDAQGRRVRRLEGAYEAGRQAFEWDLRHANGPRVAPGIYKYRLTAGRFRAQSKLVVLP